MKKVSKIKKMNVKLNPAGYAVGVLFIALIILTIYYALKPKDERMLLENGTIEKSGLYTAYVVKNEAVKEYQGYMNQIYGAGSCSVFKIRNYGGLSVIS